MSKTTKKDEVMTLELPAVTTERFTVAVLGTSPLICHALPNSVRQQLMLPPKKKNAAEKASSLKHDPIKEYQNSIHVLDDPTAPTLISLLSTSFKKAMGTAALDTPGAKKTQIGRLVYIEGDRVPIYGLPKLKQDDVRMADMNRTPDVRFRAVLKQWAAYVPVRFVTPLLNQKDVANLLVTAGVIAGVGDNRPEKGGNFGQFCLVNPTDPEFLEVVNTGGRDVQIQAMETPEPYDERTRELLEWFVVETKRRGLRVA